MTRRRRPPPVSLLPLLAARQVPAGTPGAYRLLSNIVSLHHERAPRHAPASR